MLYFITYISLFYIVLYKNSINIKLQSRQYLSTVIEKPCLVMHHCFIRQGEPSFRVYYPKGAKDTLLLRLSCLSVFCCWSIYMSICQRCEIETDLPQDAASKKAISQDVETPRTSVEKIAAVCVLEQNVLKTGQKLLVKARNTKRASKIAAVCVGLYVTVVSVTVAERGNRQSHRRRYHLCYHP